MCSQLVSCHPSIGIETCDYLLHSAVAAPIQGLSRHMMGRSWRLGSGAGQPSEMAQLLRWLHDTPRPDSPFSVHNLCSAHGVHGWIGCCWQAL